MESLDIIKTLSQLPPSISLVASVFILTISIWMSIKKVNTQDKKFKNEIQVAQVESLLHQIKLLSEELDKTRNQLSFLHEENIKLMDKLREANKRISELELSLSRLSEISCQVGGNCPDRI